MRQRQGVQTTLLVLSIAAQVRVGDGPGALLDLGEVPASAESPVETVLRARAWLLLERPEAADALLATVDDPDLALVVARLRLEAHPDDPERARALLPPVDAPSAWHGEAALRLAIAEEDRHHLAILAEDPLVAPRALSHLVTLSTGAERQRWLRRLVVDHGHTPEGRRAPPLPLDPPGLVRRAEALFRARAYDLAEPACLGVTRAGSPVQAQRARIRIGTIRMRLRERYTDALPHLRSASRGPDPALAQEARYRLALVLGQLERWDEAIAEMRRVGGRYTKRAAYQVGRLLHQAGRYREAVPALEDFLKRKLRDVNKWRWFLGWASFRGGDCPTARRVWKALRPSRNLLVGAKALYWSARCALLEEDPPQARALLDELRARAPLGYYGLLGHHLAHENGMVTTPLPPRSPHRLTPAPIELASLDRRARLAVRAGFPGLARHWVPTGSPEVLERVGQRWRALPVAVRRLPWDEKLSGRPRSEVAAALPAPYLPIVRAAGALHGVSPWWLLPHMLQESRFTARVRSHAGALGPMQVLPRTGRRIARIIGFPGGDFLSARLYEPGVALGHAAWYLAALRGELGGSLLLAAAAYNGGPRRMAEHLQRHQDLPFDVLIEEIGAHETRNYVRKIADHLVRYASLYGTDDERERLLLSLLPPPQTPTARGEVRF